MVVLLGRHVIAQFFSLVAQLHFRRRLAFLFQDFPLGGMTRPYRVECIIYYGDLVPKVPLR